MLTSHDQTRRDLKQEVFAIFWQFGSYARLNEDLLQHLSVFDYQEMLGYQGVKISNAMRFFENVTAFWLASSYHRWLTRVYLSDTPCLAEEDHATVLLKDLVLDTSGGWIRSICFNFRKWEQKIHASSLRCFGPAVLHRKLQGLCEDEAQGVFQGTPKTETRGIFLFSIPSLLDHCFVYVLLFIPFSKRKPRPIVFQLVG